MPERCPRCGRFCYVVYRWRGPAYVEVASCIYCGLNPPNCSKETGTVYGCQNHATHRVEGPVTGEWWCQEHAPDAADALPYTRGGASA